MVVVQQNLELPMIHRECSSCGPNYAIKGDLRGNIRFIRIVIRRVGPLSWLLEPMSYFITAERKDKHSWLIYFPVLAIPVVFLSAAAIYFGFGLSTDKTELLANIALLISLAILLVGGIPIIKSNHLSLAARALIVFLYYLIAFLIFSAFCFFAGVTFLALVGDVR